ncbi:hypothetical protein [uncultured Amnibacterium sp.]|uniref:hypothetical protein n=1 Tax=uncultured Amnibacterium sp. TaxID=1631851 RepID=UPI0035CAD294
MHPLIASPTPLTDLRAATASTSNGIGLVVIVVLVAVILIGAVVFFIRRRQ